MVGRSENKVRGIVAAVAVAAIVVPLTLNSVRAASSADIVTLLANDRYGNQIGHTWTSGQPTVENYQGKIWFDKPFFDRMFEEANYDVDKFYELTALTANRLLGGHIDPKALVAYDLNDLPNGVDPDFFEQLMSVYVGFETVNASVDPTMINQRYIDEVVKHGSGVSPPSWGHQMPHVGDTYMSQFVDAATLGDNVAAGNIPFITVDTGELVDANFAEGQLTMGGPMDFFAQVLNLLRDGQSGGSVFANDFYKMVQEGQYGPQGIVPIVLKSEKGRWIGGLNVTGAKEYGFTKIEGTCPEGFTPDPDEQHTKRGGNVENFQVQGPTFTAEFHYSGDQVNNEGRGHGSYIMVECKPGEPVQIENTIYLPLAVKNYVSPVEECEGDISFEIEKHNGGLARLVFQMDGSDMPEDRSIDLGYLRAFTDTIISISPDETHKYTDVHRYELPGFDVTNWDRYVSTIDPITGRQVLSIENEIGEYTKASIMYENEKCDVNIDYMIDP